MRITKGDLEITKNVICELASMEKNEVDSQMKLNGMTDLEGYYTSIDLQNTLLYLDTIKIT